jgi:hypothetical protein
MGARTRWRLVALLAGGVAVAILGACGLGFSGVSPDLLPGEAESGAADRRASPPGADGDVIPIGDATTTDAPPDAPPDAPADAPLSDTGADGGVDACTPACNAGCGPTGTTCSILITSPQVGINCPPGLDCRVECNSSAQICSGTINCPTGHKCTVVCKGSGQSCNKPNIQKNGASSLCIECSGGAGSQSCNQLTCSSTACTTYCNPQSACSGDCGCMLVVNNTGACP